MAVFLPSEAGEVSAKRTEGSWAPVMMLMTPPSPYDGDTSPSRTPRRGGTLDAAGDVDREPRDEIGVGRGEEADDVRLVGRLGDAPEGRALDLLGLRGLRALVPVRPDALGQRDRGRDGIDVDAV